MPSEPSAPAPVDLLLMGVFRSPSVEAEFRARHAASDNAVARACLLVAAAGSAFFVANDLRMVGGPALVGLLGVRAALIAFTLAAWAYLRHRPDRPADGLLLACCLAGSLGTACINLTRPAGFAGPVIVSVPMALLAYCVVPLPLSLQMAAAAAHSLACLACLVGTEGAGPIAISAFGAFAAANVLGATASRTLHLRRRELHLASIQERALRQDLERALAEVRTLRGVLSICAWCKKIRDEQQAWQAVEAYVGCRTHAEFTHGICPSCLGSQLAGLSEMAR